MAEIEQKVTIITGAHKRLATHFEVETRPDRTGRVRPWIRYKPKRARKRWWYANCRSVIIDGWDHPALDEVIRTLDAEGEVARRSTEPLTWRRVSELQIKEELQFNCELEKYLKTLEPARLMLDARSWG